MPTYSYECTQCGHVVDVFHGISAKRRVKCAECGGSCRRLIGSGSGIIFKGSGFYETDYKSKTGEAPEPAGTGDSAAGNGSSGEKKTSEQTSPSKKSETKPTPAES